MTEENLRNYQEQLGKSVEHETRLKELIVKQAQLNALLDFAKGERRVAPEAAAEPEAGDEPPAPVRAAAWQSHETLRWRRVYQRADAAAGVVMFSLVIKFEPVNWFDGVTC